MIITMITIRLPAGASVPTGRFVIEVGVFGLLIELPLTDSASVMFGLYEAAARLGAELDVKDSNRILDWYLKAWLDPGLPQEIRLVADERGLAIERVILPERWGRGIVPESFNLKFPIDATLSPQWLKVLIPAKRETLLGNVVMGLLEDRGDYDLLTPGLARVMWLAGDLPRIWGEVSRVLSDDGRPVRRAAKPPPPDGAGRKRTATAYRPVEDPIEVVLKWFHREDATNVVSGVFTVFGFGRDFDISIEIRDEASTLAAIIEAALKIAGPSLDSGRRSFTSLLKKIRIDLTSNDVRKPFGDLVGERRYDIGPGRCRAAIEAGLEPRVEGRAPRTAEAPVEPWIVGFHQRLFPEVAASLKARKLKSEERAAKAEAKRAKARKGDLTDFALITGVRDIMRLAHGLRLIRPDGDAPGKSVAPRGGGRRGSGRGGSRGRKGADETPDTDRFGGRPAGLEARGLEGSEGGE
jgi:hypothetical protein